MASDVDLPGQDPWVQGQDSDLREDLRRMSENSLYFFGKGILGYRDMTERCHGPFCAFLQHNVKQFKRALMPRDTYKTSAGTIAGSLWKGLHDTNQRILIANESATNAERMLRGIRGHLESNRTLRTLYSAEIPRDVRKVRWNDTELDLVRTQVFPEPTFDTIGMTGSVTSRHYSHMIFDDPISEEAVKSEKVMKDVINRLSAITALLTKPERDTVWLIGTRWALHDVYSWFDKAFGDKVGKFSRGIVEDGESIFPELMGLETIALKRSVMGAYKFSCLMMNNPRNEELQDLSPDLLRYWRWANKEHTVIETMSNTMEPTNQFYRTEDLDITVTVDLAPAERGSSDRNAIVTLGVAPDGSAFVLDLFAKRCTPIAVMDHIFAMAERWPIHKLGIESVAYQKAFKYFLKDAADRRGAWLNVVELKASGKKEIRVRGLQPILAVGRLYLNPADQLLVNEIADFPLGEHDDCVDALSMHLQIAQGWFNEERHKKFLELERELIHRIHGGSDLAEAEMFSDMPQYGNISTQSLPDRPKWYRALPAPPSPDTFRISLR